MKEKLILAVKGAMLILLPLIAAGFPARFFSLEYVDQRYHTLTVQSLSGWMIGCALILMILVIAGEVLFLKRVRGREWSNRLFSCNWLLFFWGLAWIFPLNYAILPFYVFCGAWSFANFLAEAVSFSISRKKTLAIAGVSALIAGIAGGAWQVYSLHHLGMQWFDWGHFYEVLTNTLKGRFFYLDLEQGCFLASRFCISLLVLLPVAMTHSAELFLLSGALLVASGALVVAWSAGKLRLPPDMALICGVGFLLLPGTINMLLAQLDGFHEVFLMVPVLFGAWGCYRAGKRKLAAALWIFSLGIRETFGFMWVMWGIMLIFDREKRRDGIILAAVSGVWTVLLLTVIMPALSNHDYVHTVFFPHLGSSLGEVALSPLLKPELFWGGLLSFRNLEFWAGLFLPFVFVLAVQPRYLLPLLPDLLMISQDFRFDTQNLLRHYQIVPLLVLTIGAVESAAYLYHHPESRPARFLRKITGVFPGKFASLYMAVSGALLSCCFAQIPLFPASDPRLLQWQDVRGVMDDFYALIPPGTPVTAGVKVASFFADRNELNVYWQNGKSEPFDQVIVESFMAGFGENALRLKLLRSEEWELKHSAYIDDRLLQLFIRRKDGAKAGRKIPESVIRVTDKDWQEYGNTISVGVPQLEMKGKIIRKNLLLSARIKEKTTFDLGFQVELQFKDGTHVEYFRSFGDGVFPACFAEVGTVWLWVIPLDKPPALCRVNGVILPVEADDIFL